FMRTCLDRNGSTARREVLRCLRQFQRLSELAVGEDTPRCGLEAPRAYLVMPGLSCQAVRCPEPRRRGTPLLHINMDSGTEQREPAPHHQQPSPLVQRHPRVEQPRYVCEVPPDLPQQFRG